ncbi:sushi, von Willebrand factor type A, EGF and pentraxin domain-containing protein 1-like isoform X2 [Acropora palmata]|uniref:sushi, von Willebrand factor type A, EGF and pentraxin domain-containing protein 1-like isoform X2 n=1 Tax=Acropora palmata TaxID=6131 RepID=UPI003D9FD0B8
MDAYSSILLLIVTLYPHSSLQSEEKCNSALGMERGDIPDESITASSQLDSNHHPFFGRLHGSKAWCSAEGEDDPYIEIKLHEEHSITALSTQGSSTDGVWSSKYRIEYHTGGKWTQYKKELPGNRNLLREKRNNLNPEILTKSIRIFPKDPFSMIVPDVKYKCLRVELYGCLPPADCRDPGRPINGERTGDEFNHGSRISFSCKQGFLLIGNSSSVCNMGKWSNALPQCKGICEDPGVPENGNRKGIGNFIDGDTIEFSCNRNYSLFGSSISRCLNGRWSSALPKCKAVCTDPGIPFNGNRIGNDFSEGQMVAFSCDSNFTLVGPSLVFCVAGQWDATTPTCKASCSNPGSPEHGNIIGSDFGHGGQVTFLCLPKYSLSGSATMTCRDGKWSSALPVCKVVCPDPGAPINGSRVGDSFLDGQTVAFRCHESHTLIGQQVLRCLSGRWSSDVPECKAHCSPPVAPSNGRVFASNSNNEHGTRLRFACNSGYKGASIVQCDDGKWNSSLPLCEDIDECTEGLSECFENTVCRNIPGSYQCECKRGFVKRGGKCLIGIEKCKDPGIPRNGARRGDQFFHKARVFFSCNKGFTLDGNSSITCQEGEWSSNLPYCRAKCANPGALSNGFRRGGDFRHGKKVTFGCRRGFRLKGVNIITCNDGTWSNPRPVCSDANECAEGLSNCDGNTVCLNTLGTYRCKCKEGYFQIGRTCFKKCADPGIPLNGKRYGKQFFHQRRVSFSCNRGYTLVGNFSMSCQEGEWNSALPQCKENCADPGALSNGFRRGGDFRHGKKVTFGCRRGFRLKGVNNITCNNGNWSNPLPVCADANECAEGLSNCDGNTVCLNTLGTYRCKCKEGYFQIGRTCFKKCADPGIPLNGKRYGKQFFHQRRVSFSCNRGYTLVGNFSMSCQEGEWNSALPQCKENCADPGALSNGFRRGGDFRHGKKVTFGCRRGFRLKGVNNITCNNGNWSNPLPVCADANECAEGLSNCDGNTVCLNTLGTYRCKCKEGYFQIGRTCFKKCADPGIPLNGKRYGKQFFHQRRVSFSCNRGYTLVGNFSMSCQEGEWNSALPQCKENCADPGALSNGFRRGGDFRHGKKVTFGCRRGFRLKGVNNITCNNGNWSNPLPVCADANECAEGLSNCDGNTVCLNTLGTYRCKCKEGYFQIGRTCFKKCADPGIPLNGKRYGKQFFHQRRVSFSCNRGYTLVGNFSMSCQEGEWNSALPQCKENCADPGALSNGFRRGGDFRHGKKVTFGCRRGFRLKGVNNITCNNGNWSNPLPVCADANECAEGLSNCDGNTVCLNTLGTYRCKCKEGYFQIGRTCFKKCADPGIPLNGKRYGKQFFHQRRVSFSCNRGYTLVGNFSMSCQEGEWNSALPQCKENCADPGALSNGFRRGGDFRHGKKVTFGCRRGFRLKGVNIITCNDGTWSNPRPVCSDSASFCRKPPIPLHAYMLTSQAQRKFFSDGERLSYRCNLGFSPTGVTFRWCKNGVWTRLMFTCNVKSCGEPETPENGRINSYLFTYNSAIEYSCDQGYTLVGPKRRVCQHNQTWTGTVPLCTLINCGRLPTPRNGEKKSETSTFLHGQVRFACKGLGFKIEGSQTRTCLESGQWSGQQPECKLITCADPGVPVHANRTIRKGFSYLGSVKFHCNANYKLEGVSQIFCKRDGTWSRPIPKCFAPCSNPGKPPNGGRTGQGFTHGKTVKFYCKRNYRLVGRKQLTCNNGNWQGQKPRCRRKNKRNS